ncbi:MAG: ABC transporter ATP-binding protein [Proteobacteria bacterium]|nr:ABC transporter ATP-binding protein [Pseudomonadota bacterium]
MSSSHPVLIVENICKCYHIYEQPVDRLKQLLLPPLDSILKNRPQQYYTEFHALQDISFAVEKGQTIGIIGANGAGKSTLLQIISGTLTPTSGTVDLNGRVAALLELGSSFNPEFTGIENVYLYGAILGLDRKEMRKRLEDICRYADIGMYVHQPIKIYSSGMVVRLAFAVIVHVDADILIIDEALTVGDAFFVQKCMRFLRNFIKNGTVLFVSHDTGAVVNLCSHVLWLEDGKIRMQGEPKMISEHYLASHAKKSQNISDSMYESRPPTVSAVTGDQQQSEDPRDMRLEYLNRTNLRNDMEIFQFQPDSPSFGQAKASIISVRMTDEHDRVLNWIVGGEKVRLCIDCKAHETLRNPIVGFYVKDRLGQHLFGDNTFLTYKDTTLTLVSEQVFQAWFSFRMPALPVGHYSISPAIAVGTQDDHVTQHWLHDALLFKSHSSSVINALIGIPMTAIEIVVADLGVEQMANRSTARIPS